MRYWWVNQNQTYSHEVSGGYMWSPVKGAGGRYNHFYETMTSVEPGDVVFSFARSHIKAVGRVVGGAEPSVKPDFGPAGGNWAAFGWLVQVEYQELDAPVRPKDHMSRLGPLLPTKYSPLSAQGNGYQQVYLAAVTPAFAAALMGLISEPLTLLEEELPDHAASNSEIEDDLAGRIQAAADMDETEKRQLINARRGQGLFRNNVRLHEQACRVTGVRQLHHLRASHIKPWRESDNEERLHGSNGLLLAPHVDHLFDRGFITFEASGDLLVSARLESEVLSAWFAPIPKNVGSFTVDQRHFLDFHRAEIFVDS